jgi:anti-sigma-K factor RskA
MKPCSRNRKLIAWLALGALDAEKAAALRDHLAVCQGCRRYWEEISNVTETLASAQPDSNLEASELFHHKVAAKLQAVEAGSGLEDLAAWLRGSILNWRVALPAIAVLAIAVLAMVAPRHHSSSSLSAPPAVQAVSASDSESDLAPTIANYQMVANQSLEKLSELLTRQGNKNLPPAPIYTASSLTLADEPF